MLRFIVIFMMLGIASTQARERIDRSIDEAASRIVAERMGDLREGFDAAYLPRAVTRAEPEIRRPTQLRQEPVWIDGLARAVERRYLVPPGP